MTEPKITWDEVKGKFDSFDHKLEVDPDDESLTNFFGELTEIFQNNIFKKSEIEEAMLRTQKIMDRLQEIKSDMQQYSGELIKQQTQFETYIKNYHIVKK
jgi:hypothetical protein